MLSTINHHAREVSLKIVYYGPGLGGKTTSLRALHQALNPNTRGQLVSLATGADRTLYFDFLPVRARVQQFSVRLQLYTVPGQVHYNSTRKLVLTGADAVVFVSDSQRVRMGANQESLANLEENLAEQGRSLSDMPLVFQHNKRDAPDAVPVAELEAELNARGAPAFATIATKGKGVFEALKTISRLALENLTRTGARVRASTNTPATGVPTIDANAPVKGSPLNRAISLVADVVDTIEPSKPEPEGPAPTTDTTSTSRSWAELVVHESAKNSITLVERDLDRSDWAAAVRHAGHGFRLLASDLTGSSGSVHAREVGAVAALVLGLPATWFQRFRETEERVLAFGGVTSDDALFALLYLTVAAVRADEQRASVT